MSTYKKSKKSYPKGKSRGKDKSIWTQSTQKMLLAGAASEDTRWNSLIIPVSSHYLFTVTGLRWMISVNVSQIAFPIDENDKNLLMVEHTWCIVKLEQGQVPSDFSLSTTAPQPNNNTIFQPWNQVICWGKQVTAHDKGTIQPQTIYSDHTKSMRKIKEGQSLCILYRARMMGTITANTSCSINFNTSVQWFNLMT